jgi:orotidine-5'-phosphate decarboxylase
VVLGLDPDPAALDPRTGSGDDPAGRAAVGVAARCAELIAEAGPACVAVKLQLACFERLGGPGWEAARNTVAAAHDAGLLTIADGKRGDVPVTATVYGQALVGATSTPWGTVDGLGADAFTANPLLGGDALEPLIEAACDSGAGIFALVRTSNPGAADLLDLPAPDRPLHERLAELVDERAERLAGESGLSGMGAVVGATDPRFLPRMRELMPRSVFLLPGVGAQGGRPADLAPAWGGHPASALVTASRSIASADDPAAAAEALRSEVWGVAGGDG